MTSEQIPQAMTAWIKDRRHRLGRVPARRQLAAAGRQRDGAVINRADHRADLFPIAVSLGINPVHLGILMTVNMEVGLDLYVALTTMR